MVAPSADHCTVAQSGLRSSGQDVDPAVWPSYLNRAPTPGGPRSYGCGTEDLRTAADFSEQGCSGCGSLRDYSGKSRNFPGPTTFGGIDGRQRQVMPVLPGSRQFLA